jgi:hypothetical protein
MVNILSNGLPLKLGDTTALRFVAQSQCNFKLQTAVGATKLFAQINDWIIG